MQTAWCQTRRGLEKFILGLSDTFLYVFASKLLLSFFFRFSSIHFVSCFPKTPNKFSGKGRRISVCKRRPILILSLSLSFISFFFIFSFFLSFFLVPWKNFPMICHLTLDNFLVYHCHDFMYDIFFLSRIKSTSSIELLCIWKSFWKWGELLTFANKNQQQITFIITSGEFKSKRERCFAFVSGVATWLSLTCRLL